MHLSLRARLAAAALGTTLLGACSADQAVAPASLDRPTVKVASSPAGVAMPRTRNLSQRQDGVAASSGSVVVRALRSGYLLSTGRGRDHDDDDQ